MSKCFRVEKAHCRLHDIDFKKYIRADGTIKVSCRRYQQCRKEAIERHEAKIAEAKLEAERRGTRLIPLKAVVQIVCPYEEPPQCIPEHFP